MTTGSQFKGFDLAPRASKTPSPPSARGARGIASPVFVEFQAEYAISDLFQRAATLCMLAGLFGLFAFCVATGFWVGAAAILGGLALCAVVLYDFRLMTIGWLVSVPTICVIVNNYVKVIPVVTVDRLFFAAVFGVFILNLIFDKEHRKGILGVEKAIILFLSVCLISLVVSGAERPQQMIVRDVALWLQGLFVPMVSFLMARRVRWDDKGIWLLLFALMGCGAVLGLLGMMQYFLKMTFFMPNYMEVALKLTTDGTEARRTTATFANAVEYGCVLGIMILVAIFAFVRMRDAILRTGILGLMGIMFIGLVLCRARAAWLGTFAGLGVVFLLDRRARPFLSLMALAGAMMGVLALPFLVETGLFQKLSNRAAEWSPIYNRIALTATALNMFIHNPIFGLGFGRSTFLDAKMQYITSIGPVSAQFAVPVTIPHNELLHILLLTGLVGFVPYALILTGCAKILLRSRRLVSQQAWFAREFQPYLAGVFIILMINAVSADIMWFSYLTTLHFFLFGVVAASMAQDAPGATAAPAGAGLRRG